MFSNNFARRNGEIVLEKKVLAETRTLLDEYVWKHSFCANTRIHSTSVTQVMPFWVDLFPNFIAEGALSGCSKAGHKMLQIYI